MTSCRRMEMLNPVTDRGGQKQQDIGARLQFMQLDAASCESIRTLKTLVERELPIGLDKFYAQLRQSPEVKRFFSSEEHIARAKGAQKGHWTNISNGDFGAGYVQKVRTIVEAAREQATALQEINTAVNGMDQSTQQNAAMVEESTAASYALAKEVNRIAGMLREFDSAGGGTDRIARAGAAVVSTPAAPSRSASPVGQMTARPAKAFHGNAAVADNDWEEF